MSDSAFKLQLLVRAKLALVKIYARRTMVRATAIAVALVFVLMGLAMLNFAAYQALLESRTPGMAAFFVALGDAICAVVVVFVAGKLGSSAAEEEMAKQIRDMAYSEVGKDVEAVKLRVEQLSDEVKSISSGVSNTMGTLRFFLGLLGKTMSSKSTGKQSK